MNFTLKIPETFPSFDAQLPDLNRFIYELVREYQEGKINKWDDLAERAEAFFTPEQMESIEAVAPGWREMASYEEGLTLVHVTCVFLGLFMLPEFQSMNEVGKQLAKWMALFHDVEKEVHAGRRDRQHGFRSAVSAARSLPKLGFAVTGEYKELIDAWNKLTYSAIKIVEKFSEPIQDNQKLPEILAGIEKMFGCDTPAALIVKGVLLHMSISVVKDWPTSAPLTDEEIKTYINTDLAALLKVMMLADNEGWSMFTSEREKQRSETLEVYQKIENLIYD